MCDLCNIQPIYSNVYNRFVRNTKEIIIGHNVALNFGIDENRKYVIYASYPLGEDYTDDFIIKYCPKCGRKLI